MSIRPHPVVDDASRPFWEGAARGQLVLASCSRCGVVSHPPDVTCPACHHTDPQFRPSPVPGGGTVRSWTVLHQVFVPGFDGDVPFVLVDVELDGTDDVRFIGRLLDSFDADLSVGSPVTLAFEQLDDGVAVPAFRLATGP